MCTDMSPFCLLRFFLIKAKHTFPHQKAEHENINNWWYRCCCSKILRLNLRLADNIAVIAVIRTSQPDAVASREYVAKEMQDAFTLCQLHEGTLCVMFHEGPSITRHLLPTNIALIAK